MREEAPAEGREPAAAANEALEGPRRARTLASLRKPLASPARQLEVLAGLDLAGRGGPSGTGDFERDLQSCGWSGGLTPAPLEVFQVNLGKLCNMTCAHCHVDAGPDRTKESMDGETVDLCLRAIDISGARVVDVTGGAPELHPHFRRLVDECAARGRQVVDRCNLSVLLLPRCADLPEWLGARGVEVACSLPHHRQLNTDAQRGDGAYEKSMVALRRLNAAGYGKGDPRRRLTLVSNPAGAYLAGDQSAMEKEWRESLQKRHGVTFDRLIALNNMPISRFLDWLAESGNLQSYQERLLAAFNPATVAGVMCRNTVSVSWDGRLFDCDFNQMLEMELALPGGGRPHVRDFDPQRLARRRIRTARHCYGCTAGAGSSCGGALDITAAAG